MSILRDIGLWLARLLPANPILVRVVTSGGKRVRHLWTRVIYLSILFLVMVVAGSSWLGSSGSLAQLARESSRTFVWVSSVQLFLMAFIAPIFTAGAITQEKDANTFHILLTTPLSSAQIVLGSLISRLYFVWVLLLSGLPIFCITMIYGGVTTAEVFLSFGLAACTALVMGALAIAISITRVGTRRTIFSFYVGVASYLIGVLLIGLTPLGQLPEAPPGPVTYRGNPLRMSWLAPVHPFMALLVVTGLTPAPELSAVYHYGWPARWLLAHPHYGFMVLTTLASIVLVVYSLFFVRRGAKEGEWSLWTRLRAALRPPVSGELRTRRPRHVWNNPIAWREAATRGSAGGRSAVRWTFAGLGLLAGFVLLVAQELGWWGLTPVTARDWLNILVVVELGVILLLVTSAAATTLTREKESLTIELLLTTPLTSQYIIAGMLRGLVSLVLPLIAVPAATLVLFLLAALFRAQWDEVLQWLGALVCLPLLLVAYSSLAAMVGLQFSLLLKRTVQAVMMSTGVVVGTATLLSGCGLVVANASAQLAAVAYPFAPFQAFTALVHPEALSLAPLRPGSGAVATLRLLALCGSLLAAALYFGLTFSVYRSMVRGFDMTVRRQTA
jgi:ABC-type transport system involved in multi-copper enzyme maturation permease subunit